MSTAFLPTRKDREPLRFAGKKVLVTGGSSGIGKQLAADFLKCGAHVTIISNDATKLEKARVDLMRFGSPIFVKACDVSSPDQVRDISSYYTKTFGSPDILINNAGFAIYRLFQQMSFDEISGLIGVNLLGSCLVTRAFLPAMVAANRGNIVIMASIAGRLVMTPCGLYSAAKHGLVAWARTLQLELSHTKLRVNVICPGRVETDFFSHESFVKRAPRRETKHTIPIESVSKAVMNSIDSNRFITYVPSSYRLLVWLSNVLPFPFETLLNYLMRSRLRSLREAEEGTIP